MSANKHWTAQSAQDLQFRVAFDFVAQLQESMELVGVKQRDLAQQLSVSEGRVSQLMNNPGNMTLRSMIGWAQVMGQKVAVVLYDDGDKDNALGPVYSGVFRHCWERQGKPRYLAHTTQHSVYSYSIHSGAGKAAKKDNVIDIMPWLDPEQCRLRVGGDSESQSALDSLGMMVGSGGPE